MPTLKKISLGKIFTVTSLVVALAASFGASPASARVTERHGYGGDGGGECSRPWSPDMSSLKVKIEGGDPLVHQREVTLTLKAPTAKKMAISNTPSFTGASIEDFSSRKDWTLSAGEGVKTVYVRFYNKCGSASPVVHDSIEFRLPVVQMDKLIANLNLGDVNNDVKKLQTELVRLGYLPSSWTPNKVYELATFAAVERYVDDHPSHDLNGMIARLHFGQYHPDVRRLQAELKLRGFMPAGWTVTSFYGTATRAGVNAYRHH